MSSTLDIELVLVSPLRRTLQTAAGLFPTHENVVAIEDLRETVMESCNLRRDKQTLRSWSSYVTPLLWPSPLAHACASTERYIIAAAVLLLLHMLIKSKIMLEIRQ